MRLFLLTTLLFGCGEEPADTPSTTDTDADDTTPNTTEAVICGDPGASTPEVLTLTTRDGVNLEADRYAGAAGCPGVVLLHMIPPSNTRADWPADFIAKLTAHGWSVVAIDRRGAGGSEGEPADSYTGEKGRYDVEAAVGALTEIGAVGLAVLGASNGTTSTLDYAVWAPTEGLPAVDAMGFMTGGSYTEAQNPMSAAPDIPAVFTYSTAERDWSVTQQDLGRENWEFLEYPNGAHGTQMFGVKPKVKGDLDDFLAGALPR